MINEKNISDYSELNVNNINLTVIENRYVKIKGPNNEVICKINDLKKIVDNLIAERKKFYVAENLKIFCQSIHLEEEEPSKRKITNRILAREENDVKLDKDHAATEKLMHSSDISLEEVDESEDSSILEAQIEDAAQIIEGLGSDDEKLKKSNQIARKSLNKPLSSEKLKAIKTIFYAAILSGAQDFTLKAKIENEVRKLNKQNKTHSFEINDKLYVISKIRAQNNSKAIQIAQRADRLAKGSNGYIFNIKYLDSLQKSNDIMKVAKNNEEAREDLLNEKKILDYIHKAGKQAGIQDSPHTVIHYNLGGKSVVGYIAPKYKMDGFELVCESDKLAFMNLKTKKNLTSNLIKGLESIHSLNLYHGDIKLQNMLYRKNELVISDFGGARKFSNFIPLDSFPGIENIFGVCTPYSISANIFQAIDTTLSEYKKEYDATTRPEAKEKILKRMLEEEIAPLLRKNDEFALGLALYSFWMEGRDPFKWDKHTNFAVVTDESLGDIYDELNVSTPDAEIRDAIYELLCQGIVY